MSKEKLNIALVDACINGNLEAIKDLLTSPDLKEHADIHYKNDIALNFQELKKHVNIHVALAKTCVNGHLEVVKYLLTSPDLKGHADIHANNDWCFINSCRYKKNEILEYLIFDYKIKKTEKIFQYLIEEKEDNILMMFDKRDLEKKLQINLQNTNKINEKLKL